MRPTKRHGLILAIIAVVYALVVPIVWTMIASRLDAAIWHEFKTDYAVILSGIWAVLIGAAIWCLSEGDSE